MTYSVCITTHVDADMESRAQMTWKDVKSGHYQLLDGINSFQQKSRTSPHCYTRAIGDGTYDLEVEKWVPAGQLIQQTHSNNTTLMIMVYLQRRRC